MRGVYVARSASAVDSSASRVGVHLAADDAADVVDGVPVVDVHAGHDLSAAQPPGGEVEAAGVAAHHDPVEAVGPGVADVLHAEVVLVGEEVGQCVVHGVLATQVGGHDLAVLDRGVPVLDAQGPPEHGVVGVGDVAGRVDGGVARAQVRVGADPVVDDEARQRPPSSTTGSTPTPTTSRSQRTGSPSRRCTRAPSPERSMPVTCDRGAQVDPVLPVQVGEDRAHLCAEDALERLVQCLEQGDLGAVGAGGRGHLEADPAAADDADAEHRREPLLEGDRVVHGAQVGDRGAAVVGQGEVPGP